MTPEELFEEALAVYVEMRMFGQKPMEPPKGAVRAYVSSIDTCEAPEADHREYWVRLGCEPAPENGALWVLFGRVSHGQASMSGLARLYWKLHEDISLFNALKPAV